MRILLTGGGTGGHIYPLAAVAENLKKINAQDGVELYYFGDAGPHAPYLQGLGIKTSGIISSKLRRYFDPRNFIDFPKFILSLFQAFWKVFWLMPDVLFSKGGPGSLPVVIACWFYRIPVLIHESDAVPSLSTAISGRFARRIAVSFSAAAEILLAGAKTADKAAHLQDKIALTGNPVREFLLAAKDADRSSGQRAAKISFGLNPENPVLLVLGGSQGAQALNEFVLDNLAMLTDGFQLILQTGEKNFQQFGAEFQVAAQNLLDSQKQSCKIFAYLEGHKLLEAYRAADAVVARAGSGLIFEIAAMAKPAILIPLPLSAQDHQLKNAYEYAKTGAAVVIEQENLKVNIFLAQLNKILSSPQMQNSMSAAAQKFAAPDAAKIIAQEIVKIGSGG